MINVQYFDLPCTVHGLIRENEDDSYTIILNSRDTRERNLKAYQHEIEHLRHGDLDADNVQKIESRTHAE